MAAVESCGQVTLIAQPPSTETHPPSVGRAAEGDGGGEMRICKTKYKMSVNQIIC